MSQKPIKSYKLNEGLADKAGLSPAQKEEITKIYDTLRQIFEVGATLDPEKEDDLTMIRKTVEVVEALEFKMQSLWGLPPNTTYHTWWNKHPLCTCPVEDSLSLEEKGESRRIMWDCPLHGAA